MNQADFRRNSDAGVTPLGHEVYEIDTRMAGYSQITAGYLIRADLEHLMTERGDPSIAVPAEICLVHVGIVPEVRVGSAGGWGRTFGKGQL